MDVAACCLMMWMSTATGQVATPNNARPTAHLLWEDLLRPHRLDAVRGVPLRLREAIDAARDAQAAPQVTQAYWELCAAVARYHFTADDAAMAQRLSDHESRAASERRARARGNAPPAISEVGMAWQQALARHEQELVARQKRLSALLKPGVAGGRPWPVDPPPTARATDEGGATAAPQTEWLFALADAATVARAEAVLAETDYAQALEEAVLGGELPLAWLGKQHERLDQQRKTFLDRSLATAALAESRRESAATAPPARHRAERQVDGFEVTSEPANAAAVGEVGTAEASVAAPHEVESEDGSLLIEEYPVVPSAFFAPRAATGRARGATTAPHGTSEASPARPNAAGAEGDEGLSAVDLRRRLPGVRFADLLGVDPLRRAQRLATRVSGGAALPESTTHVFSLADALNRLRPENRGEGVSRYWACTAAAARRAAIAWQIAMIGPLGELLLATRDVPAVPRLMLAQRAALATAHAALADAQLALAEAQWRLGEACATAPQELWPSTPFHGGRYSTVSGSDGVEPARRAAQLTRRHAQVVEGGSKLIEADESRAQAMALVDADDESLADTLSRIERETATTLDFIALLEAYNLDIAGYALPFAGNAAGGAIVELLVLPQHVDTARRP